MLTIFPLVSQLQRSKYLCVLESKLSRLCSESVASKGISLLSSWLQTLKRINNIDRNLLRLLYSRIITINSIILLPPSCNNYLGRKRNYRIIYRLKYINGDSVLPITISGSTFSQANQFVVRTAHTVWICVALVLVRVGYANNIYKNCAFIP